MLADVVALLRCPRCEGGVELRGAALVCTGGHAFDVARQGYVNLLGAAAPGTADTAPMVAAREEFLAAGHYAPLAEQVRAAAGDGPGPVVEMGAGTAYHLARVLQARPSSVGLAVDVSVPACRRAARAHPRAGAVVADAWAGLPLQDGCADVVLVVFAPRGMAELARVLAPGGRLVVLTPAADHLGELREPLALMDLDPRKDERLRERADPWFAPYEVSATRYTVRLDRGDVVRLAAMGPNAFHTDAGELRRRTDRLPSPVEVTVAATVTTLTRR